MSWRSARVLCAATVAGLALATYLPPASFFLSDDYVFLEAVRAGGRPVYAWPGTGQFIRPLVMYSFALDHAVWGLKAWGYHLTNLLLHAASAVFVGLVARALVASRPDARWVAVVSGLYFFAAAPHTEAVSWISGRSDVTATAFVLCSFWCWLRRGAGQHGWFLASSYVTFATALLAKESVVTFPLLAAAARILSPPTPPAQAAGSRRGQWLEIAGLFAIAGAYLALRYVTFGTALGAYPNVRLTAFRLANNLRLFMVRSFIPGDPLTPRLFPFDLDVLAGATCLLLLIRLRGDARRAALIAAAGLLVMLVPALPLEISLVNTQGDRFVYLPGAFSAMLVGFLLTAIPNVLRVRDVLLAVLLVANLAWLRAANQHWAGAGELSLRVLDSFAERVRESQLPAEGAVLLLNFPDNLRGVYVLRNGFYDALRLRHPDIGRRAPYIIGVSSHSTATTRDTAIVTRTGTSSFLVDVSPNGFLTPPPSTRYCVVDNASPSRFRVQVRETVQDWIVLYTTGGQVETVAIYRAPRELDSVARRGGD